KHLDYRKKNDNRWTNPATGIIYDRYAEYRKCPLCGDDDYDVLFIKCGFPHVKCRNCTLVYVNPILNKEEYEKLWSHEDSWEDVLETEEQRGLQAIEANYSLDIVNLYIKEKNPEKISICDIGCGPGTFLREAQKRGYYVFGIEPNKRCHKFLKEFNIDFIGDFFPLKGKIDKKFDCVFVLNTLEHLPNPLEVVQDVRTLLKSNGIIYVSVPNIDALVNRIMHEKAGVFAGHSHIQFFNIKTLSELFNKAKFEVLEYETIITEIGVIKNYLNYKDPYFGEGGDSFDFLTPEFIYKNHLGRSLTMVGRLIPSN
ncbi:MAG: hypothetical protein DRP84_08900, partial [Spirochaetes bacterium]